MEESFQLGLYLFKWRQTRGCHYSQTRLEFETFHRQCFYLSRVFLFRVVNQQFILNPLIIHFFSLACFSDTYTFSISLCCVCMLKRQRNSSVSFFYPQRMHRKCWFKNPLWSGSEWNQCMCCMGLYSFSWVKQWRQSSRRQQRRFQSRKLRKYSVTTRFYW